MVGVEAKFSLRSLIEANRIPKFLATTKVEALAFVTDTGNE